MLTQYKEYFFINVYATNVVRYGILISVDDIDSKKTTVKRENLITQVN